MSSILTKNVYVLIPRDKKRGVEGMKARLSELSIEAQRKLYEVLYYTEPTNREQAVRAFLAREICRTIKRNGQIIPDNLMSLAKTPLYGDKPK